MGTDVDMDYTIDDRVISDTPTITPPVKHKPGDPHQYEIACVVCGERGTLRLTVDPETAAPESRP